MRLRSPFLNPFQPYPERNLDGENGEEPRCAIEDNLTRSLFSALANAEHPNVVAALLRSLGHAASGELRVRIETMATILDVTEPDDAECGLQTWPADAMGEREGIEVLLLGISARTGSWSHNRRVAPDNPRPDAWIYVPGKCLLVVECKNDSEPLDATQMSAYAHGLRLFGVNGGLPRVEPGQCLASADEARLVREACREFVLEATWPEVVAALEQIRGDAGMGQRAQWLSCQAACYIREHLRPQYEGVNTILDWLSGPDTPDRRAILRDMVGSLGDVLAGAAPAPYCQDPITFAKDDDEYDLQPGAGSTVYVELLRAGRSLRRDLPVGRAKVVLWFYFSNDLQARIGLETYLQAKGSSPPGKKELNSSDWDAASKRHAECADRFNEFMREWLTKVPNTVAISVSALRMVEGKTIWQGCVEDSERRPYRTGSPQDALKYLLDDRRYLWRFPQVGTGEVRTISEAALMARKPAVSFHADIQEFLACENNGNVLQKCLRQAVASLDSLR